MKSKALVDLLAHFPCGEYEYAPSVELSAVVLEEAKQISKNLPPMIKNPPGGLPSYKSYEIGAGFSKKPRHGWPRGPTWRLGISAGNVKEGMPSILLEPSDHRSGDRRIEASISRSVSNESIRGATLFHRKGRLADYRNESTTVCWCVRPGHYLNRRCLNVCNAAAVSLSWLFPDFICWVISCDPFNEERQVVKEADFEEFDGIEEVARSLIGKRVTLAGAALAYNPDSSSVEYIDSRSSDDILKVISAIE
nr:hypothetical protein [Tanacetum cinerariifolium]